MGTYVRARNWPMLAVALLATALFVVLGARMVWNSQMVVAARSDIHREMTIQRRLAAERDQLMKAVSELKAATRMESRAAMLGLQAPDRKNVMVVKPENK